MLELDGELLLQPPLFSPAQPAAQPVRNVYRDIGSPSVVGEVILDSGIYTYQDITTCPALSRFSQRMHIASVP